MPYGRLSGLMAFTNGSLEPLARDVLRGCTHPSSRQCSDGTTLARSLSQWIFEQALSAAAARAYEESGGKQAHAAPDTSTAGRWSQLNPAGHRARFLRGLLACGRYAHPPLSPRRDGAHTWSGRVWGQVEVG